MQRQHFAARSAPIGAVGLDCATCCVRFAPKCHIAVAETRYEVVENIAQGATETSKSTVYQQGPKCAPEAETIT
jgi:hypothetical protein